MINKIKGGNGKLKVRLVWEDSRRDVVVYCKKKKKT